MSFPALIVIALFLLLPPKSWEILGMLKSGFWGLLTFVVVEIIRMIFLLNVNPSYTVVGVYAFYTVRDYAVHVATFLGVYSILYWRKPPVQDGHGYRILLPYAAGFILLTGVTDAISLFEEFGIYTLFILPVLRSGILIGVVTLIALARRDRSRKVPLLVMTALVLPLACGAIPTLFYKGYHLIGVVATFIPLLASAIPYITARNRSIHQLFCEGRGSSVFGREVTPG